MFCDDYGNLRWSRRSTACYEVTHFSSEMIVAGEWYQDEFGWIVLAVWRDDPDGQVMCAYQ